MHEFIVVGPIGGIYHLAYKVAGTNTYSSVSQFTNENAAHREAERLNQEGKAE